MTGCCNSVWQSRMQVAPQRRLLPAHPRTPALPCPACPAARSTSSWSASCRRARRRRRPRRRRSRQSQRSRSTWWWLRPPYGRRCRRRGRRQAGGGLGCGPAGIACTAVCWRSGLQRQALWSSAAPPTPLVRPAAATAAAHAQHAPKWRQRLELSLPADPATPAELFGEPTPAFTDHHPEPACLRPCLPAADAPGGAAGGGCRAAQGPRG